MKQSADDFKEWMDARGLSAMEVAEAMGTEEQTIRKWRSQGVPDRRRPHVERIMETWDESKSQDSDELNKVRIDFTDDEMDLVSEAAQVVQTPLREFIRRAAIHKAREVAKPAKIEIVEPSGNQSQRSTRASGARKSEGGQA